MLKCESCGRIFEELEHYSERHGFDRPPYEEWDGCPYCGESGAVEIGSCSYCDKIVDADNLYHGYCETCLKLKCTYDAALDFLQSRELLGGFFCWYFNGGHEPDMFTLDMLDVFAEIYRRRKANDLLTNSTEWLDAIHEYILEDDGEYGKDGFAQFLVD